MAMFLVVPAAGAASPAPVGRGTTSGYAVLAGSTVTNTGPTVITGDVGLSPGTAVTGFPPGRVNGTIHQTDAAAAQAKADLVTAYDDAAGRASTATISADLGGLTLTPGVYTGAPSLQLTGTLTLDGQGDENAVFIFQAPASTLTTASGSRVRLIGAAQACNVVWQVGSSATLGTGSSFAGNILALQSISVTTRTTVDGSALAREAAVTLDDNTISAAVCTAAPTADPTVPSEGTTATAQPEGGITTGTTLPGGGTTAATLPGGGSTGTTATTTPGSGTAGDPDPGGGITTDAIVRVPHGQALAASGPGNGTGRALLGLVLTGLGLTILLGARRRTVR